MTRLQQLFTEQGQSPWLDNLRRGWITSGELEGWVDRGVRGLTSNPSIFTNAILGSEDYDEEFSGAVGAGLGVEDAYWQLVTSDVIGTPSASELKGKTALASGKLAYELFQRTFSGPRWEALAERGARVQRPLWASTSTKNPDYPDTLYVDGLIGPDTVNTLPDSTMAAFEEHGTVARTIDVGRDAARALLDELARIGVDIDEVTAQLETEGVASFEKSFDELLDALNAKVDSIN